MIRYQILNVAKYDITTALVKVDMELQLCDISDNQKTFSSKNCDGCIHEGQDWKMSM